MTTRKDQVKTKRPIESKRSGRSVKSKDEIICGCEHSNYTPDKLVVLGLAPRAPYGAAKNNSHLSGGGFVPRSCRGDCAGADRPRDDWL